MSELESIDSIIERAATESPVAAPTEPAPVATEAADQEEPLLPEPVKLKPQNVRERLLAREVAQREREAAQAAKSEAERYRRELDEHRASTTQRERAAATALESGDFDGWVRASGFQGGFADLQRKFLEAQGAIPKADPKLTALEKRLAEYESREREERTRYEQTLAEQRQAAEFAEFEREVQGELEQSRLGELSGLAGFVPEVTRQLLADPNLTVKQASANLLADYRAHYEQLAKVAKVFGWGQAAGEPVPEKPPTAAGARSERNPSTALPQSRSAEPATRPTTLETRDEFFARMAAETGYRF